jgi:hypothetical protein
LPPGNRWGKSPLPSNSRPALVTALCLGVLTFSALHANGFAASLSLPALHYTVPRVYLTLKAGAWSALSLLTAWGLFQGRSWALPTARWGSVLITTWHWLDWALRSSTTVAEQDWVPPAMFTVLSLAGLNVILSRPSVRAYLSEIKS